MPKLVEFVGLPGSGKTTIAFSVINILEKSGYKVISYRYLKKKMRNDIFRIRIITLLKALLFISNIKNLICISSDVRNGFKRTYLLLQHMEISRYLINYKQLDFIIFEQWTHQEAWSLLYGTGCKSAQYIESILQNVDNDDTVVFFNVNAEVASDRIVHRTTGAGRFEGDDYDLVYSKLVNGVRLMDVIRIHAKEASHYFLEIDSTRSIKYNSILVAEYLLGNSLDRSSHQAPLKVR